MRSEGPSVPTRGSRLVGLLSMIITSVWGSGRCEHDKLRTRRRAQTVARTLCVKTLADSRLRIGDFPQHCGIPCAGGGGNIRGALVPCLVREQGEGGGLFCFRGQPQFVGSVDLQTERRDGVD